MQRLTAFAMLLLLLAAPSLSTAAETEFVWRWKKGDTFKIDFTQEIENVATVNRRPIQMNIATKMFMTWSVLEVDSDGGAVIEQTIDRLTLTLKTPDKAPIEFDSKRKIESPASRSIAAAVGPLVGAPFQLEITDRGAVENVQWSDETEAALAKARESAQSPAVSSLLSKDGIGKMLRQSSPPFPAKPIDVRGQWERDHEFQSTYGKMIQKNRFQFAGPAKRLERDVLRIAVNGTLEVAEAAKDAKSTLKNQKLSGTIDYDPRVGIIRHSEIQQTLDSERPYRGVVIDVRTQSTLTMSVRPKSEDMLP